MDKSIQEKINAQKIFCKEKGYPMFAPEKGHCWSCGRQVFARKTLNEAKTQLVTGCLWCNSTFCD